MNCVKSHSNLIVKDAHVGHCLAIEKHIKDMAIFDNMPDRPCVTAVQLRRDGFESTRRWFKMFVVLDNSETNNVEGTDNVIGYILFNYLYSLWKARTIWIEDMYISESYRGRGISSMLFSAVAQDALTEGCFHMGLISLGWNTKALAVYEHFGFINYTRKAGCHMCLLAGDEALQRLANQPMSVTSESSKTTFVNTIEEPYQRMRIVEGAIHHCQAIESLINEMAVEGGLPNESWVTAAQLIVDGFESSRKWFELLVVEESQNENGDNGPKVVAFLLYTFNYSSWNGASVFVDQLYVAKSHRQHKNIASSLLSSAAQIALKKQCHGIEIVYDDLDQTTFRLYQGCGFCDITQEEGWQVYHLIDRDEIRRFADLSQLNKLSNDS